MNEESVTKVGIDISRRAFYITGDQGNTKEVICETMEQFYNVRSFVDYCSELPVDVEVFYTDPLVKNNAGVV